jgi:predicted phage terminase large subunit-like protein
MILPLISPVDLATVESNGKFVNAQHVDKLNEALLRVADKEITRLMVFMPPRHGKSELISKYFPAWYLGTHPDHRVILSSYEADFAASWGEKARDILNQYKNVYGVELNVRNSARNRWNLSSHNGGMVTAGVGGPLSGKGADLFIIDDPIKNSEQANSPTIREKHKDWYRSTAFTRLEPDGCVVIVHTRWHEDDLGGWLQSESDEDWEILKLKAIDDGKPLWPDRFSLDDLLRIKKELGSYWFSAMYQQDPQPEEGGLLKRSWLQYYDPNNDALVKNVFNDFKNPTYTGWDLAISEKESADFTVSCTVTVDTGNGNIYIRDWTREHMDFPTQQQAVIRQQQKWNSLVIGIETNAYQAALPQSLGKYLLPLRNVVRIKDKVTRITAAYTAFEQGKVFLPMGHPLLGEFENEYAYFPTGKHDDILDAVEMAITLARTGANPYTNTERNYDYSRRNQPERYGERPKAMYTRR